MWEPKDYRQLDPVEEVALGEEVIAFWAWLSDRLSPRDLEIAKLRWDGDDLPTIAQKVGCCVRTIKRAIARIGQIVETRCNDTTGNRENTL